MNQQEKYRISAVLRQWVSKHPEPDTPVIEFESSEHPEGLSPRQIVDGVERDTPDGQFFLAMIDNALKGGFSLDEVLGSFEIGAPAVSMAAHHHP